MKSSQWRLRHPSIQEHRGRRKDHVPGLKQTFLGSQSGIELVVQLRRRWRGVTRIDVGAGGRVGCVVGFNEALRGHVASRWCGISGGYGVEMQRRWYGSQNSYLHREEK